MTNRPESREERNRRETGSGWPSPPNETKAERVERLKEYRRFDQGIQAYLGANTATQEQFDIMQARHKSDGGYHNSVGKWTPWEPSK